MPGFSDHRVLGQPHFFHFWLFILHDGGLLGRRMLLALIGLITRALHGLAGIALGLSVGLSLTDAIDIAHDELCDGCRSLFAHIAAQACHSLGVKLVNPAFADPQHFANFLKRKTFEIVQRNN